ncbi:MAG: efflux RND transporter permease subunit [Acidobacteriota bacterium]
MNLSEIWIRRPVMTTLVMIGILLFGLISYHKLPINNLPDVEFPTIQVSAALPGASPETMAATVATPLEKQFSSIAGIESMISTSTLGSAQIVLQFSLDRSIDAAALDVSSALNAAMGVLPRNLPNPPVFQKVNPADMPIMFVALYSDTLPVTEMYDYAENVMLPNLATINGVGLADAVPRQKYAVRVQVDPQVLANRGIGINQVSAAIQNGNVNMPGGTLDGPRTAYTMESNGQLYNAKAFESLIVTYQHGYPVRIKDLGRAIDGLEFDRAQAVYLEGGAERRLVVLRIRKLTGSNTVQVTDRVKAVLPRLEATMPSEMKMDVLYDQSLFIKESIYDVQFTMVLTILLVVAVIFLFVRALKPTIIPSVTVPLSLIATFTIMSLCGYSLNNLSMMALILAIGFVVDDAIVVLENIIRRMEGGETALEASLRGSREIGFTVLSMTLSLVVVFVPILFMGGILGRLFREFAVSIAAAILISGFLSLTLTPMMASRLLRHGETARSRGRLYELSERAFNGSLRLYERGLRAVMRHRRIALAFTVLVTIEMVHLFGIIPKGFIPNQDQNFFRIFSQAQDKTSYQDMVRHVEQVDSILMVDPDLSKAKVGSLAGFSGDNTQLVFVSLLPRNMREHSVDEIIDRLRPKLAEVPGLTMSLVNPPIVTIGSRLASAQWQYTLQSTDIDALYKYSALMEEKIRGVQSLTDVRSDLQLRKPMIEIEVDRDKASALGLTLKDVQEAFYSGYGQRQISTIYTSSNYYYVILEMLPEYREHPPALSMLYVQSPRGDLVPISTVAKIRETVAPLAVNHSGQIPAATVSFNLKPGFSIGDAIAEVNKLAKENLPQSIQTGFQGSAQAFQSSFASMGFLLIITVILIYMVLGVLYESYIHPLTILTALPLAGFGALGALHLFGMELDMYAYVGIILLVGIVKKNGIMMVDFALEAERTHGWVPERSIVEACLIRFRPIMMTTMAALFGSLPIAVGYGAGGEARQPLGVAVVGGLLFSQMLTLFVTPVFYVYFDRLNRWLGERRRKGAPQVNEAGV